MLTLGFFERISALGLWEKLPSARTLHKTRNPINLQKDRTSVHVRYPQCVCVCVQSDDMAFAKLHGSEESAGQASAGLSIAH